MPERKCLEFADYKRYICTCGSDATFTRNLDICNDQIDTDPVSLSSIMLASNTTKIKYIGLLDADSNEAKPGDIVITKDKGGCILVMKLLKNIGKQPITILDDVDYVTLQCNTSGGEETIMDGVSTNLKTAYENYTWFTIKDLMNDMSPAVGNLLPLLQNDYKLPKTITSIKCGQNCARLNVAEYVIAQEYEEDGKYYYYPESWFAVLTNNPAELIRASVLTPRLAHINSFLSVGKANAIKEGGLELSDCKTVNELKTSKRVLFELLTSSPYNLVVSEGLLDYLNKNCCSGIKDNENIDDNEGVVEELSNCACPCDYCEAGCGGGGSAGSNTTADAHYRNAVKALNQILSGKSFTTDAWVFVNGIYHLVKLSFSVSRNDDVENPDISKVATHDSNGNEFFAPSTYCYYSCGDQGCWGGSYLMSFKDSDGNDLGDLNSIFDKATFTITNVVEKATFGERVEDCDIIRYEFKDVTVYKKINRCDYSITLIPSTDTSELQNVNISIEEKNKIYSALGATLPSTEEDCSETVLNYGDMGNREESILPGFAPDIWPEDAPDIWPEEEEDDGGDGGGPGKPKPKPKPDPGPEPESSPPTSALRDFNQYLKWFTDQTIHCDGRLDYLGSYSHQTPKQWSTAKDPVNAECWYTRTGSTCESEETMNCSGYWYDLTGSTQPRYGRDDYIEYKIMYIGNNRCKPVLARRIKLNITPETVFCKNGYCGCYSDA